MSMIIPGARIAMTDEQKAQVLAIATAEAALEKSLRQIAERFRIGEITPETMAEQIRATMRRLSIEVLRIASDTQKESDNGNG